MRLNAFNLFLLMSNWVFHESIGSLVIEVYNYFDRIPLQRKLFQRNVFLKKYNSHKIKTLNIKKIIKPVLFYTNILFILFENLHEFHIWLFFNKLSSFNFFFHIDCSDLFGLQKMIFQSIHKSQSKSHKYKWIHRRKATFFYYLRNF
jgi:hypothetical protein